MKKAPDVNDTLQAEGVDAVRARHDRARPYNVNGNDHAKPNGKALELQPFDKITLPTARNYLIKGLLPRTGLVVVWGPPKCGKSFWTFDVVMHVGIGWPYRGRRVQQGPVVYLALEGGFGFRARIEAWRRRHLTDHHRPVPFYLIDVPIDLIAECSKLINTIETTKVAPAVVVIDTLNRALIGDENKSDDMAKFIRAADTIRAAFSCLVIIIHHCGVQGSRPRGHTSLSGADDAQIAVERDQDGNIIAKVEHMKDGEAGSILTSRLERVELGVDDDGDPVVSCVIVPVEGVSTAKGPKLSATNKLALTTLESVIAAVGKPAPTELANLKLPAKTFVGSIVDWRDHFYKAHAASNPDSKQKAFVRATVKLQELKMIEIYGVWVWQTPEPDKPDKS